MEASVVSVPHRQTAERATATRSDSVPWHIYAVVFASTSVVIGVLWDISWHQTIGRDTFWSPPHMAIYLGGVVAGVVCGWHVLHVTFAGTQEERAEGVSWWRYFRGPFGAWMCIWGAIAMLTSGPFDDWWHNAYGLDVKILSPPHAVLAWGILGIQLGAMLMALALQNRSEAEADERAQRRNRVLRWLYIYAAALVLLNFSVMASEYTWRIFQHGALFYQVVCGALVFPLVAAAVGSRLRWPTTAAAAIYMGFLLLLTWIFPLFPAEPKLAPIRFPIRQMMPPQFPLLLIVPAIAMDLVLRRWSERRRGWLLAGALGAVFLVTLFAAQWPFADFLNSEHARNPVFGQHLRPYMLGDQSYFARGEYVNPDTGITLIRGLGIAFLLAVLGARLGLAAGGWMRRVRR